MEFNYKKITYNYLKVQLDNEKLYIIKKLINRIFNQIQNKKYIFHRNFLFYTFNTIIKHIKNKQ